MTNPTQLDLVVSAVGTLLVIEGTRHMRFGFACSMLYILFMHFGETIFLECSSIPVLVSNGLQVIFFSQQRVFLGLPLVFRQL